MADCIFCKIVAGEIPSARVCDDADHLGFMDINPVRPGHVLLVPKKHYERLTDMPGDAAAKMARLLPRLAGAVVMAAGADGFNLFLADGTCAGQEVPHVHLHIIPRRENDGRCFEWKSGSYQPGELEAWQAKIATAMKAS